FMKYTLVGILGMLAVSSLRVGAEDIEASAYVVMNAETGALYASKNPHERRQIASLTKMATALVVVEKCENLSQKVVVEPSDLLGGANALKLKAGDQVSIDTALHAALMASDNTSAQLLARHTGGGDVSAFMKMVNAYLKRQGIKDTHLVNPHGLDSGKELGSSTALDMARLGSIVANRFGILLDEKFSAISEICKKQECEVEVFRSGKPVTVKLKNTNTSLAKGYSGMKTGTTSRSGPCLILTKERKNQPTLVCVVLNAEDRFGAAEQLIKSVEADLGANYLKQP
ncbi:MAG: serine hydrolase, partial [Verrucomicrobiota bacterium]